MQASARVSLRAHGGVCNGLTCFVCERESKRRAKRVLPSFVRNTCVLRDISEYCGFSRAILVANAPTIKLSSIFSGCKRASLYKAVVCIVL